MTRDEIYEDERRSKRNDPGLLEPKPAPTHCSECGGRFVEDCSCGAELCCGGCCERGRPCPSP